MVAIPIDLENDILTWWTFAQDAARRLQALQGSGKPLVLTDGERAVAVILDPKAYRVLLEENEILRSLHQGLVDVNAGNVVPHEEARARLLSHFAA